MRRVMLFAAAAALFVGCGSNGASSGSGAGSASTSSGSAGGSASCEEMFPASQTASQPCCLDWGIDACGAELTCAALDGRTQPTCYPIYSRQDRQQCTADNQCISGACDMGTCALSPGATCTPGGQACGPGPNGDTPFYCNPQDLDCQQCYPESTDPACTQGDTSSSTSSSSTGGSCTPNVSCLDAIMGCKTPCDAATATLVNNFFACLSQYCAGCTSCAALPDPACQSCFSQATNSCTSELVACNGP